MANQQQNVTIPAPGSWGLNLEEAPLDLDPRYALVANNAVIDKFGRLGSRKGLASVTASMPSPWASVYVIGRVTDGDTVCYVAGVDDGGTNKLWELKNVDSNITATELPLPAGYTLATPNVQILSFAGRGIIIAEGSEMLVLESGSLHRVSDLPGYLGPQNDDGALYTLLNPTCGLAAYGRLWITGMDGDKETVLYSDLLDPSVWYDGKAVPTNPLNTAGFVNAQENWPDGEDQIQGIAAHNNQLVFFGVNSMLVWGNPQGDPAAVGGIFLSDTIDGIGLVDRDAIAFTGQDFLFIDSSGLRSLGRTIQEQSAAIGNLTANVRTVFSQQLQIAKVAGGIKLTHDSVMGIAIITLQGSRDAWVADTQMLLPNGAFRITRWPGIPINNAFYDTRTERLFFACTNSAPEPFAIYDRNSDFGILAYTFEYSSPTLSFGNPVREKILKQIDYTVVSGQSPSIAFGSWEYVGNRPIERTKDFPLIGGEASFYADPITLYGVATYGNGEEIIKRYRVNTTGAGENVIISFKVSINGSTCSLQQINTQAILGRIQ